YEEQTPGRDASEKNRAKQEYLDQTNADRAAGSIALNGAGTKTELIDDNSWQDLANCLGVDPDLFFPERGASTREAKEVCRSCVVREECLDYALGTGQKFGIWGGMSERERRRIRRQRTITRNGTTFYWEKAADVTDN